MITILGPLVAALGVLVFPNRSKKWFALAGGLTVLFGLFRIFSGTAPGFSCAVLSADFTLIFRPDNFSVLFGTLIGLLSLLAIIFSFDYIREREGYYYGFLLVFIAAMELTVLAGNFLTLFLGWELMTLSSYFLIIFDGTAEAEQAGKKYFLMTGLLSLLMLCAIFGIHYTASRTGVNYHIFLLCFLVAAGVKAGVVPFHTWLPEAHPAAPSPVSALLSGVMIKVGVYLLIRVLYPLFMPGLTWQVIISFLGAATILVGVINALNQHDLKRLLAFHSISQIGYIILGLGCGTGLGLAGALFHVVNHALFKGLLFLVSGVILAVYGTKNLDDLSGLFRKLPLTFIACLVASLSISGVPPFNGFASKWVIYQALLSRATPDAYLFLVVAMFGSALTLASFLKVLAGLFFGPYKAPPALRPERLEGGFSFGIPLVLLSLMCILIGVWPYAVLKSAIQPITENLFGPLVLPGLYQTPLVTGLLLLALLIGLLFFLVFSGRIRRSETYIGGEQVLPEMDLPATQFYKTLEDGPLAGYYRREAAGVFDLYFLGAEIKNVLALFAYRLIRIDQWLSFVRNQRCQDVQGEKKQ